MQDIPQNLKEDFINLKHNIIKPKTVDDLRVLTIKKKHSRVVSLVVKFFNDKRELAPIFKHRPDTTLNTDLAVILLPPVLINCEKKRATVAKDTNRR